ncbi:hypothetical protein IKF15_04260 [Candidatus Saccharibacteria bacterium]|nr:hypothetical protein [Candidatus Saccharibacteria bacterium]
MNNPNATHHEGVNTSEDFSAEGVSWTNPGKFPAFMSGVNNVETETGVEQPSSAKEASLEIIRSANQDVENTLLPEYVESSLFDRLGTKNLDITAIRPVQEQLCSIPEQSQELFLSIIDGFDRDDNWRPYFTAVLNNFTNGKFAALIESASNAKEVDLSTLSRVMAHKDNYLDITDVSELQNIDSIIDNKIVASAEQGDLKGWQNFSLLKKFNLSLDESKILVQKYAYRIEDVEVQEYGDMKNFLDSLKQIISAENPEEFRDLLAVAPNLSIQDYPDFQIEAQRMCAESFNQDLFSVADKEFIEEDGVRVINAGTDFKMIVRSDGAFSERPEQTGDSNYSKKWNRPSRSNTSFSTSLIASNHLLYWGLSEYSENSPTITYGFSGLDDDAIVENAMGDDATIHRRKRTLDTSSYGDFRDINPTTFDGCGQRFMTFENIMDDSSRALHTETVMSRFYKDENDEEQRRQPSYVVYVKTGDNYREDAQYEETKKAARDFNIPVVVIDMEQVLAHERAKVDSMREDLKQNWSLEEAVAVIQSYSNNAIKQLRSGPSELVSRYFPDEINGKSVMEDFISEQLANALSTERQSLFDELMVLNAKKRIVSDIFMAKLEHANPDITANLKKYGNEIYGITINDQSKEVSYGFRRAKGCIAICEENGLGLTDELLAKHGPNELRKAIKACKDAGVAPSEELALIQPYELERVTSLCQENNIKPTPGLLKQQPFKLECKITKCRNGRLPIEASILEKSDEEIDKMVSTTMVESRPTTGTKEENGFEDFSADRWSDSSWDDWA